MTGLAAMLYREARLRATNATFIFWDVVYPLAYLLVFGVGMSAALGSDFAGLGAGYSDFFLAGVLAMASFGIASNTAWSLFMDRDNGIFYEMLTYPLSRAAYLVGKVLFNTLIALVQALVTGLVLTLVARPLSVLVSSVVQPMGPRDLAFISWAGLRGAVPIVLATIPLSEGVEGADDLFDIVFVMVVVYTLLTGPTLPWVARRLRVARRSEPRGLGDSLRNISDTFLKSVGLGVADQEHVQAFQGR